MSLDFQVTKSRTGKNRKKAFNDLQWLKNYRKFGRRKPRNSVVADVSGTTQEVAEEEEEKQEEEQEQDEEQEEEEEQQQEEEEEQ